MSHVFRIFNADTSLQFDLSNRLFRTLTSVQTGTSNGSVAIPPDHGGEVVAVVTPSSNNGQAARPSISGGMAHWEFDAPTANRSDGVMSIVVY